MGLFDLFHRRREPKVISESFEVLALRVPDGVSADAGFAIRDLLNDLDPEGWWFLNPTYFIAAFRRD